MTKIYLGASNYDHLKVLEKVGAKNVIFSYYYFSVEKKFDEKILRELKERGASIMMDSGAVSLYEKGARDYDLSYIDSYADFLKRNVEYIDLWVVPDVIGNFEKTMKYSEYLLNHGVDINKTVYVVHSSATGGDFSRVFDAIDRGFTYIGFGGWGFNKQSTFKERELEKVYFKVVDRGAKTHFFAVTVFDLLLKYVPDSADSVTWVDTASFLGAKRHIDGSLGHYARIMSEYSSGKYVTSFLDFDDLEEIVSANLQEYLGDLYYLSLALNARKFVVFEKILNDERLREIYAKLKSMNHFSEAFYTDLSNYLYSISSEPEVKQTPRRWINALNEYLSGYVYDPVDVVGRVFETPTSSEIISVKIPFSSLCMHHLLPFYGKVYIEYVPSDRILGLSKFSRLVYVLSRRLQLQEKLTNEIYTVLSDVLRPKFLRVKIKARHLCNTDRGIRMPAVFVTEVSSDGGSGNREGKT